MVPCFPQASMRFWMFSNRVGMTGERLTKPGICLSTVLTIRQTIFAEENGEAFDKRGHAISLAVDLYVS